MTCIYTYEWSLCVDNIYNINTATNAFYAQLHSPWQLQKKINQPHNIHVKRTYWYTCTYTGGTQKAWYTTQFATTLSKKSMHRKNRQLLLSIKYCHQNYFCYSVINFFHVCVKLNILWWPNKWCVIIVGSSLTSTPYRITTQHCNNKTNIVQI